MAKVKGTWRFNDVLTFDGLADHEHYQQLHYTASAEIDGVSYKLSCDEIFYCGIGETIQKELVKISVYAHNIPGYPAVFYAPVYDNGAWIYDGPQTITIAEEQEVSDEFYAWFTANAVPVMASITHNGSTLAELFPGQTATLKCKGMKMEDDVVVKVAEQSGGECNHEAYAGETANAFFGIPKAKIEKPTETSLDQFYNGSAVRCTDDVEVVFGASCACKYTQSDWGDYLNLRYKTDSAENIVDITYAWEEDLETLRSVLPYMGIDASQLTREGWYWLGSGTATPVTEEERFSMYCVTAFDFMTPYDKEAYFYSLFDFYAGTPTEHAATPSVAVVDENVFATNGKLCNGDIIKLETGKYYPHLIDTNRNDNGTIDECVSLKNRQVAYVVVGVDGQVITDEYEWAISIDVVYMNPKTGMLDSFNKVMTNENRHTDFVNAVYSKYVKSIEFTAVSGVSIRSIFSSARQTFYAKSITGLYPVTNVLLFVDKIS